MSALLCPLRSQESQVFGVLVAINKLPCSVETLDFCRAPAGGVLQFTDTDTKELDALLSFAIHAVQSADLYRRQSAASKQLGALASLCADSVKGLQRGNLHDIIYAFETHGRRLFNCDKCSFFAVDPLSNELLGWYLEHGDHGQERLRMHRLPREGIVALCVNTGESLNISEACCDPRFSNASDLETGYSTNTILCQPIISCSGQVIGALECVNKLPVGKCFDEDDNDHFRTVAKMFSDLIQGQMTEASMQALQDRTDVHQDVKDSVRLYVKHLCKQGASKLVSRQRRSMEEAVSEKTLLAFRISYCIYNGDAAFPTLIPLALDHFNLIRDFNLSRPALDIFVTKICCEYRSNPYHNLQHAFSTFHLVFLFLVDLTRFMKNHPGGMDLIAVDHLALLLAALGHDAGHRGYNNTFETSTSSDTALRYNDISPLESMHASVTCSCLQLSQPALVETMDRDASKRMRTVIIHSILATDMAKHNDSVAWLTARNALVCPLTRQEGETVDTDSSRDLCGALLHCADIGHPCLPWETHKHFSLLACRELFNQFQAETERGLPTLPFMGKDPTGPLKELGPSQAGFVNFVVAPLYVALNHFSSGTFQYAVDNLQRNKALWERIGAGDEVADAQPFSEPNRDNIVLATQQP